MYFVCVDGHRESRLSFFFKKTNAIRFGLMKLLDKKLLGCGDVQVFYKNRLMLVIERKRIKDLSQSHCDGRLQNCYNMPIYANQHSVPHPSGVFVPLSILIVEGNYQRRTRFCLPKNVLEGVLDKLRYQIPCLHIVHVKNTQACAERILELIRNIPSGVLQILETASVSISAETLELELLGKKRKIEDKQEQNPHKRKKKETKGEEKEEEKGEDKQEETDVIDLTTPDRAISNNHILQEQKGQEKNQIECKVEPKEEKKGESKVIKVTKAKTKTKTKSKTKSKAKPDLKPIATPYGTMMRIQQTMLLRIPGVSPRISNLLLEAKITAVDVCLGLIQPCDITKLQYSPSAVYVAQKDANRICEVAISLESQKESLGAALGAIRYVNDKNAKAIAAMLLDRLTGKKPCKVTDLLSDPLCKQHKISEKTIRRVFECFKFHP